MLITELQQLIAAQPEFKTLCQLIHKGHTQPSKPHILLTGLHASAQTLILSALHQNTARNRQTMLIVLDNPDDAQYCFGDLQALNATTTADNNESPVYFFPSAHRRRQSAVDDSMMVQRTEVLAALADNNALAPIIVTYPKALSEFVPQKQSLLLQTISLQSQQLLPISQLTQQLNALNFTRVDFVYEPGQYAVRGGIVDIYSFAHDDPYRIDFFGDEIDTIREFDIETQLSKQSVPNISIVANTTPDGRQCLLTDYLDEHTIYVSNDWNITNYKWVNALTEADKPQPDTLIQRLSTLTTIELAPKSTFSNAYTIAFNTLPQPSFNKNFDLLIQDLQARQQQGYQLFICADQVKQTDRLQAIFDDKQSDIHFVAVNRTIHQGFIDHTTKICCYTDHQIFERYHRIPLRAENTKRGKAILTLKEINQLQIGDYVVHIDHGIGQFAGLVTTNFNGRPQETIKLVYRGGDTLFVSIHNLHRIAKYKGREGTAPTVSRLGSGAWERIKERTKDKVKDIARDLIKLYATRKQQPGFAFSPDGYMQHELEASFLYEDTPDQAKATLDIKHDMESRTPMDRLVCGDVGFGKTEVAMRAAFKAATDGKQVAVLVPTTVLALQHYNTFKERFKDFPVNIQYLSRAKNAKETKQILEDLKSGKIDILIGTHKLVGKQVEWKDLGLLIIDEEQKFGVTVKEKLKSMRTNIDVLTLTATPIPRTLQFSLLGARDLSIINTPPPNRYPVQTELITSNDEDLIQEAIRLEIERNGQIYVVCNRIEMLPRLEQRIQRLYPQARTVVAHGQMPTSEIEQKLEDFINYDYDILISTTIIESGIDIPNVNTIIIYAAQNYGLADLHQLRGRVGRSNRKAFCYLVAPEKELLTEEAVRRLHALSTFADLGAGFNLAMQDLDIRGAGNMLGSEQSGFIADLGYDTYQRILAEAVQELKDELNIPATTSDNESNDTTLAPTGMKNEKWCIDSQLESDLELCLPADYVENISERVTLYRELDNITDENALLEYQKRLIDRFGAIPEPALQLLNVVRLRWICCKLGIEKVILKQGHLTLFFTRTNSSYWQSDTFGKILQFVCARPQRCRLQEEKDKTGKPTGKRYVIIQQVNTISGAITMLNKMM